MKSILESEYPTLINAVETELCEASALSGIQEKRCDTFEVLKLALKNNKSFTWLENVARDAYLSKYKNVHSSMITWRDLEELQDRNMYPWPLPEGAKCRTPGCKIQQHPDVSEYIVHCCKACAMREYRQMTNWHCGDDAQSQSEWLRWKHGPNCASGIDYDWETEDQSEVVHARKRHDTNKRAASSQGCDSHQSGAVMPDGTAPKKYQLFPYIHT